MRRVRRGGSRGAHARTEGIARSACSGRCTFQSAAAPVQVGKLIRSINPTGYLCPKLNGSNGVPTISVLQRQESLGSRPGRPLMGCKRVFKASGIWQPCTKHVASFTPEDGCAGGARASSSWWSTTNRRPPLPLLLNGALLRRRRNTNTRSLYLFGARACKRYVRNGSRGKGICRAPICGTPP